MTYKTTPLLKPYHGESIPNNPKSWVYRFNKNGVIYLSAQERKQLQVRFIDGIAYDQSGKVYSTNHIQGGKAKYVMDDEGRFYVALKQIVGYFQHSSFLSGEPVAAAGEMKIDASGQLKLLSDRSNHYKPSIEFTKQAIAELIKCGVNISQVTIDYRND